MDKKSENGSNREKRRLKFISNSKQKIIENREIGPDSETLTR